MIGQGVLRECLVDPTVERILILGRRGTGQNHAKLTELILQDLSALGQVEDQLRGHDTAFWCLGVSLVGISEDAYRRVTYELTTRIARGLSALNPGMTFAYVSGRGTDSTEKGRAMWARMKGMTENALLRMPFKAVYMFRPGLIRPMHGIRSPTRRVRVGYAVFLPLILLASVVTPNSVTSAEMIGRAMIHVAQRGALKAILLARDINELAG
jgi:hypothetical protein